MQHLLPSDLESSPPAVAEHVDPEGCLNPGAIEISGHKETSRRSRVAASSTNLDSFHSRIVGVAPPHPGSQMYPRYSSHGRDVSLYGRRAVKHSARLMLTLCDRQSSSRGIRLLSGNSEPANLQFRDSLNPCGLHRREQQRGGVLRSGARTVFGQRHNFSASFLRRFQ